MEYFQICTCSGSFKEFKDNNDLPPTAFLKELKECIDFNTFSGYNWMGDEHYPLIKNLPDDKNVLEIQYCLEYLKYLSDEDIFGETASLWNFIEQFLGIKKDSEYDYLLMNYLSNQEYTEHGSGIRCSWIKNVDFKSDPEKLEKIKKYINEYKDKTWDGNIERPWLIKKD